MAKFDTKQIRRDNPINEVAAKWGVKLKKDGREWRACCPFHHEDEPSFSIFVGRDKDQHFHCFGCDANGDVIDFAIYYNGLDPKTGFNEACEILGGKRSVKADSPAKRQAAESYDPYADYEIRRPPASAVPILPKQPTPSLLNPKRLDGKGRPATVVYKSPTYVHEYRDPEGARLGYVLRIDFEGRKITPAIMWAINRKTGFKGWIHGPFPEPRPIYRLPALVTEADKQVLVVEGEKCADCGGKSLEKVVTISWLGGGKSYEKTNWAPLRGRRVVFWEDNDPEGENTIRGSFDRQGDWRPGLAELAIKEGATSVKVVQRPGDDKPKGWDLFDAVHDDKMGEAAILKWASARTITWTPEAIAFRKTQVKQAERAAEAKDEPAKPSRKAIATTQTKPDKAEAPGPSVPTVRPAEGNVVSLFGNPIPNVEIDDDWRKNLIKDSDGKLVARRNANYIWMLRGENKLRGCFAYNEMARKVFIVKRPPWIKAEADEWQPREIDDDDVTQCTASLEKFGLTPRGSETLAAIAVVAKDYSFNPVRHYLTNIVWDKTPRLAGGNGLDPFVVRHFGIPADGKQTPLYAMFFVRWMVSAVARALRPGCKADCMVVLEGVQGHRKSSLLSALATVDGVSYFTDDIKDIESKDAAINMQGCWIVEIPELDAFRRKETDAIKAWLSRSKDRFRAPYAKMSGDYPRQSVIAGTMNPSGIGYLKDATGARRFWPVPIMKMIDIDAVIAEREQLWAEAVHHYRRNMPWYLTPDEVREATEITNDRYEEDAWSAAINDLLLGSAEVTVDQIMAHLAIPRHQQNGLTIKRIAEHLRRAGYSKRRKRTSLIGQKQTVWVRAEIDPKPEPGDDDGI